MDNKPDEPDYRFAILLASPNAFLLIFWAIVLLGFWPDSLALLFGVGVGAGFLTTLFGIGASILELPRAPNPEKRWWRAAITIHSAGLLGNGLGFLYLNARFGA